MRYLLTLTHSLIYLFLAFIALSSCKKNLEEERNFNENSSIESFIAKNKWTFNEADGIYHVVRVPEYGYLASRGDTVEFWYRGYTLDGKIFDTNVKSEAKKAKLDTLLRSFVPIKVIAGESNLIDGLNDGLLQIRENEFATILFASDLGFGGKAFGTVEAWSPLAYDIELLKVNSLNIQQEKSYISGLNLVSSGFSEDTSGLFYNFETVGTELPPTIRDTIYGWYKGTLFNGTVFDEISTDNRQIVLSSDILPPGVKLGFMLTRKTGITELVLPSYLGFGNNGNDLVKPYETIRYRIRLDSIKQ
ncbi:MAG: hypothetical protein EHM93_18815 [Bacteroidales bacterium]|nr:MAG: hypothetical protein EHM93_18815 [Bacteroidales bacterium]